jgi:hypothetical protein
MEDNKWNKKCTKNNKRDWQCKRATYQKTPPMENTGLMAFFSILEKFRIVHV